MAKQNGPDFSIGTYDHLCFYKLHGNYYVRMKSSLSRKRVKTDPAFARTMQYAGLLGKAAKLAAAVYRLLPKDRKEKGLYRKLTGMAMQWLKEGHDAEQLTVLLRAFVEPKPTPKKKATTTDKEPATDRYAFADAVIASIVAEACEEEDILTSSFCHAPP